MVPSLGFSEPELVGAAIAQFKNRLSTTALVVKLLTRQLTLLKF